MPLHQERRSLIRQAERVEGVGSLFAATAPPGVKGPEPMLRLASGTMSSRQSLLILVRDFLTNWEN